MLSSHNVLVWESNAYWFVLLRWLDHNTLQCQCYSLQQPQFDTLLFSRDSRLWSQLFYFLEQTCSLDDYSLSHCISPSNQLLDCCCGDSLLDLSGLLDLSRCAQIRTLTQGQLKGLKNKNYTNSTFKFYPHCPALLCQQFRLHLCLLCCKLWLWMCTHCPPLIPPHHSVLWDRTVCRGVSLPLYFIAGHHCATGHTPGERDGGGFYVGHTHMAHLELPKQWYYVNTSS